VRTGLADEFLPELPGLALEQDPIHRHKDVLAHTLAVVDKTSPDRLLRLAALFHDKSISSIVLVHAEQSSPEAQILTKMLGQCEGQFVEAALKGCQSGRVLRLGRSKFLAHGQHEAALVSLHGRDQGKRRGQTDLLGIAGVEARNQRLQEALARLRAEPPACEGRHRFVPAARRRTAWQNQIHRRAQLGRPRQERRHGERAGRRGCVVQSALGRDQPPLGRGTGPHNPILDA